MWSTGEEIHPPWAQSEMTSPDTVCIKLRFVVSRHGYPNTDFNRRDGLVLFMAQTPEEERVSK
jgi:hypothetical protein